MLEPLKKLLGRNYVPLNQIFIFKENLEHNYKYLNQLHQGISIAPVLKSNAYGHGIEEVARIVKSFSPPFVCVDSIFEAHQIQKAKINVPILIMGYVEPSNLRFKKYPFSYAVFDWEYMSEISKYQPDAKFHIFVDTGMNREGIRFDELEVFKDKMLNNNFDLSNIEGIMSHFASAAEDKAHVTEQIYKFNKSVELLEQNHIIFKYKHISASFGLLKEENINCNIARSGLALYGYGDSNLKPALRLTSKIAQVKNLKAGEKVGYSGTFTAQKDMKIAVLPLGYANGLDRRLSNIGKTSISLGRSILARAEKKILCPIIGRISMNIATIDVSELKEVNPNDQVTVISEIPSDENSIENIAKKCGTIEYDILVHLDQSIKRVVN